MRIICDHCSQPVSGTVKRVPGNLNLHPDCLAHLRDEATQELMTLSPRRQELSFNPLPEWKGPALSLSPKLN
jgi:hypothetical protein